MCSKMALLLPLSLAAMARCASLDIEVDAKKHLNHVVDSLDLLLYVSLLILTIVTIWVFKQRRARYLHESGLAIVYGLGVGVVLRLMGTNREVTRLHVVPGVEDALKSTAANPLLLGGAPASSTLVPPLAPETPPDVLVLRYNVTNRDSVLKEKVFTYTFHDEMAGKSGSKQRGEEEEEGENNEIQARATFNPEIFFYVLLPPIIFYAGYGMHKKHFFDNFGAIMLFALVGTTVSAFVIGALMYLVSLALVPLNVRFLDAMYFGAVISATDPVTVLAIFHDLNVDSTLNGLILGESLLNDAVAVVLCTAIEEYSKVSLNRGESLEPDALLLAFLRFLAVVFGSIALGAAVAAATAVLTKFTRLREFPLLETSLFTLMSYTSYLLAEINEMSGIVSVLFCGICQAHYTYHNLSDESKQRTTYFFENLNFLAENFIFSYIGVSMFTFSGHVFSAPFILGAFVAIAVARAAFVFPLGQLANLGRRQGQKLPMNYLYMMWFSGLRGAMAFALAVQNTVSPVRRMFFTTTSLVSIVTVIFNGGLTTQALAFLKIPVGVRDDEREGLLGGGGGGGEEGEQPQPQQQGSGESPARRAGVARGWVKFDRRCLKPLLTSCQPSLMETMPAWCLPVAACLTSREQMDKLGDNPAQRQQQQSPTIPPSPPTASGSRPMEMSSSGGGTAEESLVSGD